MSTLGYEAKKRLLLGAISSVWGICKPLIPMFVEDADKEQMKKIDAAVVKVKAKIKTCKEGEDMIEAAMDELDRLAKEEQEQENAKSESTSA